MNKLEVMEVQIESLEKIYRADLERKLEILITILQTELNELKNNPHYKPNSCGIVQGNASDIDELCIKLGVIDSIKRKY